MKIQWLLTVLFFRFLLIEATGQDIPRKVKVFSVEDGLTQSSVQSISRDIYGFIWISTGDGLNCFDGKEFKNYYPPTSLKSSVKAGRMRRVICDEIGNLWVGSDEGLYYFNRITNKLEDPFPEIITLKKGYCMPLLLSKDTIHALLADSSIISINIKKHTYRATPLGVFIYRIHYSPHDANEIWCLSWPSVLWCFDNTSGKLRTRKYTINQIDLNNISDIKHLKNETYLVSLTDKLLLFDRKSVSFSGEVQSGIPPGYGNSNFRTICRLKSGDIWIGTTNQGIIILDSKLKYKNRICSPDDVTSDLEPLPNISLIYEDVDGNIWIGTDGAGLGLINPGKFSFKKLNTNSPTNGKLSSDFIRCFFEDEEGNLWIGTYNEGINKWNRKTNTIEHFHLGEKNTYPSPNDIYSLCLFESSWLLAGTCTGLWIFNTITHDAYPLSEYFNQPAARKTFPILNIAKNHLMAVIDRKVYGFEKTQTKWLIDTIDFPDTVHINLIFKDKKGLISGFSNTGIYEIAESKISYKPYVFDSDRIKMKINSVAENEDGTIFAATEKGLVRLKLNGQVLKIYDTDNGLPNHYLYGVLTDSHENLWISSNRGLSRFNSKTGKFDNFGMDDGLQSLEFNSGASYKNNTGEMFFGGIKGFNYFHPDSLYPLKSSPNIIISSMKVNDMIYLPDSSTMSKRLVYLGYNQNTLSFEFNTIEFIHPGYTVYSYLLKGYDKRWIQAGLVNQARYAKLPPGTYVFYVKAANRQGIWSKNPAFITIIIARPFWMKTWFIVSIALIAFGLISGSVYYLSTLRIKRRLVFLEQQQEINLIRRRISSDLHDDIGTGLSKLAMMSDKAILESNDSHEVEQRLKKLSSGARHLIDQLRVIVWTLNPQYDHLESLISYIHQQAGDFLDNFPIRSRFVLPEDFPPISVTPEVKRNIHYTVMEAIHNAVKHSGSKDILVEITIVEKNLKIEITDHGKGIYIEPGARFGNGLIFMRKRISDIKGKFEIESKMNEGTRIIIEVEL